MASYILRVGFVKFLQGFYFLFIKEKRFVGKIGEHKIFAIKDTACVYIPHEKYKMEDNKSDESRYKRLFFGGMDLDNFYFSYTYDLTRTLQFNMTRKNRREDSPLPLYDDKFVWNHFLLQPLFNKVSARWILPCIHGCYIVSSKIAFISVINNFFR